MNTRLLGILCMIGGAVKLITTLLYAAMPGNGVIINLVYYSSIIAFPLLMAGPLGLQQLHTYGTSGVTAKVGIAGVIIALLGLAIYVINWVLVPPPLPAGTAGVSTAVGMTILGIAVLLAKKLDGWYPYAPLGVGVEYFLHLVVFQILNRYSQGLPPLHWLIGIWWLTWLILGYVISVQKGTVSQKRETPQNLPNQALQAAFGSGSPFSLAFLGVAAMAFVIFLFGVLITTQESASSQLSPEFLFFLYFFPVFISPYLVFSLAYFIPFIVAFILPAHMKRNLARTLAVISGFAAALIYLIGFILSAWLWS